MIVWLTGHSGSGKTTLSCRFSEFIHLDGDQLRGVWPGLGLSLDDRMEQNMRVARLAKLLDAQGCFVMVSVIAPTQFIRDKVDQIIDVNWVWVKRDVPEREGHIYEPNSSYKVVDNNGCLEQSVRALRGIVFNEL